jgi:hypothetical protein
VPEQKGEIYAAMLARSGEVFEVVAGYLVGGCDDDRRGGGAAPGDLNGEPLDDECVEEFGVCARSGRLHDQECAPGWGGGCGWPRACVPGKAGEERVEADEVGTDLAPVVLAEQRTADLVCLIFGEQAG